MTPSEFSRPVRVETLGPEPRRLEIEADCGEREALAQRFGLQEITALAADMTLVRAGVEVTAKGVLRAAGVQSCAATGEPVPETVEAPFELVFRPAPDAAAPDEEVELTQAELDVIFYDGPSVDLGEAMAETLLLSLDPYPRAPGAEQALREAGIKSEEEARVESSPFAALEGLKAKLKN